MYTDRNMNIPTCHYQLSLPFILCSYQFSVILLIYLLPLLVMLVTYSLVGQSLWGGHIPGEASDHYHGQITAKRKVTHFYFIGIMNYNSGLLMCKLHYYQNAQIRFSKCILS